VIFPPGWLSAATRSLPEHADAPYAVTLLRLRHERPGSRSTAEESDEVAAPDEAAPLNRSAVIDP
jgi:hypothetical protein